MHFNLLSGWRGLQRIQETPKVRKFWIVLPDPYLQTVFQCGAQTDTWIEQLLSAWFEYNNFMSTINRNCPLEIFCYIKNIIGEHSSDWQSSQCQLLCISLCSNHHQFRCVKRTVDFSPKNKKSVMGIHIPLV